VFTTAWAADYPAVPLGFQNHKFAQPANKPWAKFHVVEYDRKRQSVGAQQGHRFVRVFGYIIIDIYVPEDTGTRALNEMMDRSASYLEEKNFTLSSTRAVTTLVAKRIDGGAYEGFELGTVMTPYWFDEALPVA
jgi:hypothetical protein